MHITRRATLGTVLAVLIAAGLLVAGRDSGAGPLEGRGVPASRGMEDRGLSGFSQLGTRSGRLTETTERAFKGTRSAKATYLPPRNGYARGVADVGWRPGENVLYSAAFFLPPGFKDSMRGGVAIMRWDNYPSFRRGGDFGGLVIYNGDKKLHLIRGGYSRGYEAELLPPVDVPEGRWVRLAVRQTLSTGAGAVNKLYLDGALVAQSTAPNSYGRAIERVRYGIVSVEAGLQTSSLTMFFDDARASRRQGRR